MIFRFFGFSSAFFSSAAFEKQWFFAFSAFPVLFPFRSNIIKASYFYKLIAAFVKFLRRVAFSYDYNAFSYITQFFYILQISAIISNDADYICISVMRIQSIEFL